jgi:hypothetical protein
MKIWVAALAMSLLISGASFAASVTVPDNSPTMPNVAATATAVLLDAGISAKKAGGGNFVVEAKGIHCDQHSNGPVDAADPHAGLPTVKCRIDAQNKKDTKSGRPFAEARTIFDLFDKVQQSGGGGIQLTDCAMGGYCGAFAKSIRCTINTAVDDYSKGGRWSCVFTDGQ